MEVRLTRAKLTSYPKKWKPRMQFSASSKLWYLMKPNLRGVNYALSPR
jgi:hypothetical protein